MRKIIQNYKQKFVVELNRIQYMTNKALLQTHINPLCGTEHPGTFCTSFEIAIIYSN